MKIPELRDCNYDADEFARRVDIYVEAVRAEIEMKTAAEQHEKEAWAASLQLRADDFEEMARNDADNRDYCLAMAEEYKQMAKRALA